MIEWTVGCQEQQIEALSDALESLSCLSLSVEDAEAGTLGEQALFGEPGSPILSQGWRHSRVRALFSDETQAQIARMSMQQLLKGGGCSDLGMLEVPDLDWVQLTQAQFAPVQITSDFWIVPSWHEAPAPAEIVMRLDPGLAFGTGTHPTTRMCLQWLAGSVFRHTLAEVAEPRILDYGCGSGILGIAAALFAERVARNVQIDAVDLDDAAVQATRVNAQSNSIELNASGVDGTSGEYHVVLANILATPLKVLAPLLCAKLRPAGHLVLAGILETQADELMRAYEPWLDLVVSDQQEGWVLMTAQRSERQS